MPPEPLEDWPDANFGVQRGASKISTAARGNGAVPVGGRASAPPGLRRERLRSSGGGGSAFEFHRNLFVEFASLKIKIEFGYG